MSIADGLPVIGALEATNNVLVATGHAMLGLFLAPITGRLIAELLTVEPASVELAPFRPDRF